MLKVFIIYFFYFQNSPPKKKKAPDSYTVVQVDSQKYRRKFFLMILISHVKPNLAKSLYPMDDHQFVGYITKLTANNTGCQPGKTFETMGVSQLWPCHLH